MALPQKQVDLALRFIEQVRREPVWFAEQVLNHRVLEGEPTIAQDPEHSWELDQFQRELLEAVADVWRKRNGEPTRVNHAGTPWITVRSGHGSGKTHIAALIINLFNTAWPGRVVCTAPKLNQLRTRIWGALRKIHFRAEPWYRSTHTIHDTAVYWKRADERGRLVEDRNWCVLAETASQPENLAGHHEQYQLVVVEEATGVKEHLWPVIFGAVSSGAVQIVLMISNPSKNTGTFANSHLKATEAVNYFRYHITLANAKRIKRGWAEAMARKYGKTSPYYKIRVLGDFADAGENQLLSLQWLEDARADGPLEGDGTARPKLRVSVDVADGGEDETVITVGRHLHSKTQLLKQTRHSFEHSVAPIESAKAAERMFLAWGGDKKVDDFVVDALGVGAGTAGWLMDQGYRVVTFRGGEVSDDPKRWRNRRVQTHLVWRNALRDGTVELSQDMFDDPLDWDDFYAQCCSVELDPKSDKVEDLLTKEEMKRKGIKSPDMEESAAMQFAAQAPRLSTSPTRRRALAVVESNLLEGL